MILAAGLGTRLKPWTLEHPKALVPVAGVPMLERVIGRLRSEGFDRIVINIHHFGEQIIDFINAGHFGDLSINISDERGKLLDTGGGLLHAADLLSSDTAPFLVHNADILSDAPLAELYERQMHSDALATLLVSQRDSSRRLAFDRDRKLCGWHDLKSGALRPANYSPSEDITELAFSGIYSMSPDAFNMMRVKADSDRFPVMDFFLDMAPKGSILGFEVDNLNLIDIGKPETLARALDLFTN